MKIQKQITTLLIATSCGLAPVSAGASSLDPDYRELVADLVLERRLELTAAERAGLPPELRELLADQVELGEDCYARAHQQGLADGRKQQPRQPERLITELQEHQDFADLDPELITLLVEEGYQAGYRLGEVRERTSTEPKSSDQDAQPEQPSTPTPAPPASEDSAGDEGQPSLPVGTAAFTSGSGGGDAPVPTPTNSERGVDTATYPVQAPTMSQRAFIEELAPAAQRVAKTHDLYASVLIAQAALESNFGQSSLATQHHNYFGIKGQFRGQGVSLPTVEHLGGRDVTVSGIFRHYPSAVESLADYATVLAQPCYEGVHRSVAKNYRQATRALVGTYATDPNYDRKLNQLIDRYQLTQYDRDPAFTDSAKPKQKTTGNSQSSSIKPATTSEQEDQATTPIKELGWQVPVAGGAASVGLVELFRRLWR